MFSRISLATILAIVYSVRSQSTPMTQCSNGVELPLHTYVRDCLVPPCLVAQGTDAEMNIIFRNTRVARSLKALAVPFLLNIPLEIYELPPELQDGCALIQNTYCPIVPGEVIQIQIVMPILYEFPPIPVTVEISIEDENEDRLFCVRLNLRVTTATRDVGYNATQVESLAGAHGKRSVLLN